MKPDSVHGYFDGPRWIAPRATDLLYVVEARALKACPAFARAVRSVARRSPDGNRFAILMYDEERLDLVCGFGEREAVCAAAARALEAATLAGESGPVAELQREAFRAVTTPGFLEWRDRTSALGRVVHLASSYPAPSYDLWTRDWVQLAHRYRNARVGVHTIFVERSPCDRGVFAAYHNVMSAITDSPPPFLAVAAPEALTTQLAAFVDGRTDADRLAQLRVPPRAVERFKAAGIEATVADLLEAGPLSEREVPNEIRGLVREDACNKRFRSTSKDWVRRLEAAARSVRRELRAVLVEHRALQEDAPVDCISSSGLDELVSDFVEAALPPFPELFFAVSRMAIGIPMYAPFASKTGKYNYQSAFGASVRALRDGYTVSCGNFFEYYEYKAGSVSTRRDLQSGVDDFVLRDQGQITGVFPAALSPLSEKVLAVLAGTPWLDAISWYSLCRHFMPPPNAAAGLAAAALWWAAGPEGSERLAAAAARTVAILPPKTPGPEATKAAAWACRNKDWSGVLPALAADMARSLPPRMRGSTGCSGMARADGGLRPSEHHEALVTECLERAARLARASGAPSPGWSRDDVMAALLSASFPEARLQAGCGLPSALDALKAAAEAQKAQGKPRTPKQGDRRLLPVPGTKRFNKRLADLVCAARRLAGLPITGLPAEEYVVTAAAAISSGCRGGAELCERYGDAAYVYEGDRWAPARLGAHERRPSIRGGRLLYSWPDEMVEAAR